jgi:DNA polymerase-3 subunit beta
VTATLTSTGLVFTADRTAFASAVTWAAKRVSSRPTIPAHGGILLTVADSVLTVAGYNENASATATVDVEGSDGKVLVSGRLLADLMGTLPDKPVQATVEGNSLAITCGRAKVTLPLMIAEDFVTIPALPPTVGEVDASALARAVKLVGVSCDVTGEKGVPSLAGINLKFGDLLTVEASDRYRAAYIDIPWQPHATDAVSALPHGGEFLAVAADLAHDGSVTIGCTDTLLGLSTATRSVVVRQIGEPFHPNLRGIFPERSRTPARVAVADLKPVLDRVRLMTAAKDFPSVTLTFAEGVVQVCGSGQDASTAEEIACAYDGPPTKVAMSVRYLLAALTAEAGTEVVLTFAATRGAPFVLDSAAVLDNDEESPKPTHRQLIASMRPGS